MNLELMKQQPMKWIFKYAIPSIIAMILSSFVTIVDGFFISNYLGKNALAAINLGLPILFIYLAVGLMIGVGGVSIAGQRLGQKNVAQSIEGFNQTLFTSIVLLIILSTISSILIRPVLQIVNLEFETSFVMLSYYSIMLWGYPLMMVNIIFGLFIRCEGKPHIFLVNTIVTTLLNIVLDYLFIVKLSYGIRGAAYSSVIALICGTLIMVWHFVGSKTLFSFRLFSFNTADLKATIANGSSELIGQLSGSITMFFLNMVIMNRTGLTGVAAMTIVGYARYIYNMIVVGFGQGINPLISFSFGAREYEFGNIVRKYTNCIVVFMGILFYLILGIAGEYYARIFTQDATLISIVNHGLKIFGLSFILGGFNDVSSFYFTARGNAKESAIISGLKGLIFLVINIFVLPSIFGEIGIWLIAPFTEMSTFIVAIYLIRKHTLDGVNKIEECS